MKEMQDDYILKKTDHQSPEDGNGLCLSWVGKEGEINNMFNEVLMSEKIHNFSWVWWWSVGYIFTLNGTKLYTYIFVAYYVSICLPKHAYKHVKE